MGKSKKRGSTKNQNKHRNRIQSRNRNRNLKANAERTKDPYTRYIKPTKLGIACSYAGSYAIWAIDRKTWISPIEGMVIVGTIIGLGIINIYKAESYTTWQGRTIGMRYMVVAIGIMLIMCGISRVLNGFGIDTSWLLGS